MSSLREKDIIEVFKEVKVGPLMLFRSRRSDFFAYFGQRLLVVWCTPSSVRRDLN